MQEELLLKIRELKKDYSVIVTSNMDVNYFKIYAISKQANAWIPSNMLFGMEFILNCIAYIVIEAAVDNNDSLSMSVLKDRAGLQVV